MQLILKQAFPLGRFHATPWKIFPYDDPHGEWPPSPWRLVRAVLARSYQLDREIADSAHAHAKLRKELVRAFAKSQVEWHLPPSSWRGPSVRQYHPAEFRRVPASAKEPGLMAYNTTKVLDNFWVTSNGTATPVIWYFDGPDWTPPLLAHLDACLARMTYFGRAESITEIQRIGTADIPGDTVKLLHRRSGNVVPVLALQPDATLDQLEATSDAREVAATSIPPGSRWMYAKRPSRPRILPIQRPKPALPPTNLIQFAIGSTVATRYQDTVRITERFRARVLGCFTKLLTGEAKAKWADAPSVVREQALLLSGRDPSGNPSRGHRHASFFLCGDSETPSRLCIWRAQPFHDTEQRAIHAAASSPLPLNYKDDPWTLNLVPLDKLVPAPPGLDDKTAHLVWKNLTPYVPSRHVYGRSGKAKVGDSVLEQLTEELVCRGFNITGLTVSAEDSGWVKVHRAKPQGREQTSNDKLGYAVRLVFPSPVKGPISLGASSHFGLGLFVPVTPLSNLRTLPVVARDSECRP